VSGEQGADIKVVAVIDDDPRWHEFVELVFEDEPVALTMISTALGAAGQLREIGADLVLVDLKMAAMPGDVFISGARRLRELQETKFVICSNADYSELEKTARWSGADGFVRKTGEPAELRARVFAYLDR
jgi:DNA-binding response OmpR family regulator